MGNMLTKAPFTHSKISEFSMNPNLFCRIENMSKACKSLIVKYVRKVGNVIGLLKIYSCTTMTPIVVRL